MRSALRPALVAIASTIFVAAAGCTAPTLPLPPPSALVEAPDVDGFATVTGEAQPGAFVFCVNERLESGVIVRADMTSGAYSLRIPAVANDTLVLWQEIGTEPGEKVERFVPEGTAAGDGGM